MRFFGKAFRLALSSVVVSLILVVCSDLVLAQNVRGVIRDKSGSPVEGARVRIENTRLGAISDNKGRFTLFLQPGTYTLSASYLSFRQIRKEITVAENSSQTSQNLEFVFEEQGVISETVLVQAVRAGSDAPVAQTLISQAAIDATFQGQDVQFILEKTAPSLIAFSEAGTSYSNYGSFRMRGIDQTRINITFNGVPLNDMIDQGVFFSNITDLTNSARSMQILRGVGVSSNGTSSYGGSLNLEGMNLQETQPSVEMQLSSGSFGLLRGSAEVKTGKMANNMAVYAKFSTFSTDGYRINTASRSYSAVVSAGYFGVQEMVKLTGIVGRTQNQLAYFAVPKPLIDRNPRTNINDSSDRDDFGQHLLQLEYTRSLSAKTTLAASVYYGGAGGDYFTGFRDTAGVLTQINYPLRNDHLGGMISLTTSSEDNSIDAAFGLHGYTFLRRNWETIMPDYTSNYYDDKTVKNEMSAFAKASYRIGEVLIYGDVQARYVEMRFTPDTRALSSVPALPIHSWFFLNPKIGATLQASENMSIYASFGRTGREPTRFDMLGSTQIVDANINVLRQPNTVRPEFVNDVEGGLRLAWSGLRAQVNGFYMQFHDEIAAIGPFIPQGFVQLRKNVAQSYRAGIELEADAELTEQLRIFGNASWMQAAIAEYAPENLGTNEVFRNVRPIQTPSIMGAATLQYKPLPALTLEVSGRYVGESFLELTNNRDFMLPAFGVLDSRIEWRFLGEHRINVALNNILNALYFTNGSVADFEGRTVPTYFVQAPRNIVATLTLKF
ncbi:MAG: TonB-dependent receptor [Candidatus Kapabacteria bacterium]|jgi:iron complex outermembrane receptor protein|nr:TonB-dependent receptor [Candidatus Kapabacteria bacterium]